MDALYNIKRKKYKTVCAELASAKVTLDRMVMIFDKTCNVLLICHAVGLLQYSKSVWSKVGTLTVYILISCIFNAWKNFQKWKRLQNVRHIYNVFKFWGIFSTFLSEITLFICREYLAYSINIMLCYLFLKYCYLKQKIWIL